MGEDAQTRIDEAMATVENYGSIDGEHHKTWVIDQVVRALLGPKYEEWVREHCDGEDGPNTYEWPLGIPP